MAKQNALTYQHVLTAALELVAAGEKPSVRKLHSKLGGSHSTLSEHLQRWQAEQLLAKQIYPDLSEPFRQAVLAEIGRATESIKNSLETQVATTQTQLKEAQEIISENEAKIESINGEFDTYKNLAEQKQLKLEKELSSAQALVAENSRREKQWQSELAELRNKLHHAELNAAVAETKVQELNKQNNRFEQELNELKDHPQKIKK